MPALYIGHGAPMMLDDPLWTSQLSAIAQGIATPKAILIISAHWESTPITLSSTKANSPLVYDFGGFAPKFYEMQYNTPDSSALAARIAQLLPKSQPIRQSERGLDHGAWVPLRVMYPDANIPVLQMSMPTSDPGLLMNIGKLLQPLKDEGVLIIGSGFMTHGLRYLRDWSVAAAPPAWSEEFDTWVAEALSHGDIDALSNYQELAPALAYAHPTVEHFTPLFITLGAAKQSDAIPETLIDGYFIGLSKRSILVA